jgi:hypothetical protein
MSQRATVTVVHGDSLAPPLSPIFEQRWPSHGAGPPNVTCPYTRMGSPGTTRVELDDQISPDVRSCGDGSGRCEDRRKQRETQCQQRSDPSHRHMPTMIYPSR